MEELKRLITELENLNTDFVKKTSLPIPNSLEEVEKNKSEYKEAGNLIINFYRNQFIPQYSQSAKIPQNIINEVGYYLSYLANTASDYINDENSLLPLAIGVLLINWGDSIKDPNNLERLIRKLKKVK